MATTIKTIYSTSYISDTLRNELKKRLSCLKLNVLDEDLAVKTAYTVYAAENRQWLAFPNERIRQIDVNGVETVLIETIGYTLDLTNGEVTLNTAVTADDTIRADYWYELFTNAELDDLITQSLREISSLTYRNFPLDVNAINSLSVEYREAVLKRAYSNAFKCLLQPTFNYFSVTIAGRAIDKTAVPTNIQNIINSNEELLMQEINNLRYYNKSSRFE